MSIPDKGDGSFPVTSWTRIGRLKSGDEAEARRALDELCAQYHYPLYCAIRHRGLAHHDAEDALHEFLAKLLRLEAFAGADAEKGRLRAFLSAALGRFLANWHRDRAALAREVSLDAAPGGHSGECGSSASAEARFRAAQFADHETPGRIFDRQWACDLLARVLARVGADYAARGKGALFTALSPVLQRGGSLRGEDTAALAAALGLGEGNLRKINQRLLEDYRRMLEEEVLRTVGSRCEVEAEIAHLLASFR
jgi:DNA-directed RNA polymerase specialized sigma24 family protein